MQQYSPFNTYHNFTSFHSFVLSPAAHFMFRLFMIHNYFSLHQTFYIPEKEILIVTYLCLIFVENFPPTCARTSSALPTSFSAPIKQLEFSYRWNKLRETTEPTTKILFTIIIWMLLLKIMKQKVSRRGKRLCSINVYMDWHLPMRGWNLLLDKDTMMLGISLHQSCFGCLVVYRTNSISVLLCSSRSKR